MERITEIDERNLIEICKVDILCCLNQYSMSADLIPTNAQLEWDDLNAALRITWSKKTHERKYIQKVKGAQE